MAESSTRSKQYGSGVRVFFQQSITKLIMVHTNLFKIRLGGITNINAQQKIHDEGNSIDIFKSTKYCMYNQASQDQGWVH